MFDIGKIFHKKQVDPVCDLRQVKKLMADLPVDNPADALGEITFLLGAVCEAEGCPLDDRMAVIKLLDETGLPFQRKLAHEYLSAARMHKQQENRLWLPMSEFHRRAAAAYLLCLSGEGEAGAGNQLKEERPLLAVRAMQALGAQCKWMRARYRVPDERLWREIYHLYQHAETGQFARTLVQPYPESASQTSLQQEFLRCLMLETAAPDSLAPMQIDLVDRLAAQYASSFVLAADSKECTYYVDLEGGKPPVRLVTEPLASPMMRFFGAGSATQKLEVILQQVEHGSIPKELGGSDAPVLEELLDVLSHVLLNWSKNLPHRKHERKHAVSRLNVVHTFPEIRRKVSRIKVQSEPFTLQNEDLLYQERLDLKLYGFVTEKTKKIIAEASSGQSDTFARQAEAMDLEGTESWVMENVSDCGFGAVIPQLAEDWLRLGMLLGLRQDTVKEWSVGVVRRLTRDPKMKIYIGIQTLSHEPVSVRLMPLGKDASVWEQVADARSSEMVSGLLLSRGTRCVEQDCLLLERGIFESHKAYELMDASEKYPIKLTEMLEQGEDFERVAFSRVEGAAPV
jgi:cyclic-di-GMP-binding protein